MPRAREPKLEFTERVAAASKTIELLMQHGMKVPYTDDDIETAGYWMMTYAEDPDMASKEMTTKQTSQMTPAALRALDKQLRDFSTNIVSDAEQLRTYVTNKLLEESDNPDARIRIRALELLGKISDVGLFSEKREVTVTHQTSDELRDALRAKLTKLVNADDVIDAEVMDELPDPASAPAVTVDELDAAWDDVE